MAIDFMVMPFSRYLSGDFVTPNMQWAWDQQIPYAVFLPDGKKECPPGVPFGGPEAPEHRRHCQSLLPADFAAFPAGAATPPWDEASAEAPRFHRVDPASFGALLEHAERLAATTTPRFFGLLAGAPRGPLHVLAGVFLPGDFPTPFLMQSPFEQRLTGSAVHALAELAGEDWPDAAHAARDTLKDALQDAIALTLPMIVDS
jgi:hypothetical protein